ncbi:MAG: DASS family sodium-coupled anion symporter [bacterium]|nr:DASS family sodium-coupled anion symporter [bacterium]
MRGFDGIRMSAGLVAGPAAFLSILLSPVRGIGAEAHGLLAVLALVVIFWITEAIPLPVTALLGSVLAVLLGVAPAREVFAPYGDPIIFLFMGSFVIARAMSLHGLDRRFASCVLRRRSVARSPTRMLFALGLICAFLSMGMSNTAVAAMMIPFAICFLGAFRAEEAGRGRLLGSGALAVAYSSSIGGVATPIGTPPNLITLGLLRRTAGIDLSFLEWMIIGLPVAALMLLVLMLVVRLRERGAGARYAVDDAARCALHDGSPLSRGEKNTLVAIVVVAVLWLAPGFIGLVAGTDSRLYGGYNARIPESAVALIGALLLFILPVDFGRRIFTISWDEAARINWGTILLFGGGLSLGSLMFGTGLGEACGRALLRVMGGVNLAGLMLIAIVAGNLLTEFTSNTAATNILIPIVIALARALGLPVLPPVLGACFGASMAFMLPVSTPPNAIAYASGHVPITRMISAGVLLDILAVPVILVVLSALHWVGFI